MNVSWVVLVNGKIKNNIVIYKAPSIYNIGAFLYNKLINIAHNICVDLFVLSNEQIEKTLSKLTSENIQFRLTENTASAGFLLKHICETQLTFNRMLFGEPLDFTPTTFRVESDACIALDVNEIIHLQEQGKQKIIANLQKASDEYKNEVIKTCLGDHSRAHILYYLFIIQAIMQVKPNWL